MVKNKLVRFIVPIITCCLVFVACVVPAKATDTSFYPTGNVPTYQALAPINMEITVSRNDNSEPISTFIHPLAVIGVEGYVQEEFFLMYDGPGIGNEQYGSYSATTDITQYEYGTTNTFFKRIRNMLKLPLQDFGGEGGYSLESVDIHVGSFAYPTFNNKTKSMLNNAFIITGAGEYVVEADIKYVTRAGIVESYHYTGIPHNVGSQGEDQSGNPTTNYGRATCFYWGEIDGWLSQWPEYNGGWILFENITIKYSPRWDVNPNPEVGFDCIADKLDNGDFPSNQYDWSQFYTNNDIFSSWPPNSGTNTDNVIGDFITGTLSGVFETDIADGVSLGGIFITVVGCAIALWILKLFAGG